MERHYFLHPLFACGWRIRMDVHSLWHFGVRFTRHHPPTARHKEQGTVRLCFAHFNWWANSLTYYGICIGSRQPPQYQARGCTWPLHPDRTLGTSSEETFVCGWKENTNLIQQLFTKRHSKCNNHKVNFHAASIRPIWLKARKWFSHCALFHLLTFCRPPLFNTVA